jgi:hypothetical protein
MQISLFGTVPAFSSRSVTVNVGTSSPSRAEVLDKLNPGPGRRQLFR